jgi:hypothetical protein
MEQDKIVEQDKQNTFVPYSNRSQTIVLGGPLYLPSQITRHLPIRETRRIIFEYLRQLWIRNTDALTIAREKRKHRTTISQRELELLDRHEGTYRKPSSRFQRQRRN